MGIYDRDYMRAPRDERPTWPPKRSGPSPLVWVAGILVVISVGRYAYLHSESLQRLTRVAPIAQPQPTPIQPPSTSERNPFPDDPTWRTGPRVPIQPVAVRERRLQTVFKCVRKGAVRYSGSADCAGGQGTSMTIDPGPESSSVAKRSAPASVTSTRSDRSGLITSTTTKTTTTNMPHVDSKRAECNALDQEVIALDNAARRPQGPQMQDMLRQQRERVLSRQFSLHC